MTDFTPVDLLAFGPRPDDIEIGMAGTIAKHTALGYQVGLCDLTRGELASNGMPEQRLAEGAAAGASLGAAWRVNLGLSDGGLSETDPHVQLIVDAIRRSRPRAVAIPFAHDRHPDHVAANRLLLSAVVKAALRRYVTSHGPWQVDRVCCYFINDSVPPSFVVDVSDFYERKRQALACHKSQFQPASGSGAVVSPVTSPLLLQLVESRDAHFGALAGVRYAEGFVVHDPVVCALLTDRWPAAQPRT